MENRKQATVYDGWVICPQCGKKILKVNEDTSFHNLLIFCRKCKYEVISDLDGSMTACTLS